MQSMQSGDSPQRGCVSRCASPAVLEVSSAVAACTHATGRTTVCLCSRDARACGRGDKILFAGLLELSVFGNAEAMTLDEFEAELRRRGVVITLTGMVRASALADVIGVSSRTLSNWRASGEGPPAVQIGNAWMYRLEDIHFRFFHPRESEALTARELRTQDHAARRPAAPCSKVRRSAA